MNDAVNWDALVKHGIAEQQKATTPRDEFEAWQKVLALHLGPPDGPPLTRRQREIFHAIQRGAKLRRGGVA